MNPLFSLSKSLTAKLVLAFILVAVPPMLIAGQVATTLVNNSINMNMEHWLRGLIQYIFDSLEETEVEINAVFSLIQKRFTQNEVRFTPQEIRGMSDIDVDFILLKDAQGNILYTSVPGLTLNESPLFQGMAFRWSMLENGNKELAIVSRREVTAEDNSIRIAELGSWFSVQLTESGREEPVEVRLFLPSEDGFRLEYSSLPEPPAPSEVSLPHEVVEALKKGVDEYFIPDPDWTDNSPNAHYLFRSIRSEKGDVLAVAAVSAHMKLVDSWIPSASELFWGLFIIGTLFSGCVGYILARQLSRPLRVLNRGVRSIASGNLDCQIEVKGEDEVAELGRAFNFMTKQLEFMRHESIVSARQERSRMLGEVALGFAHEIRNPLVIIKTSAELVHNKLPQDAKEFRLLGFVIEEVGRIDSLISEFLSFAKPAPLKLDFFLLGELMKEIIELSAAECIQHGVVCSLVVEAEDDTALAERNQIRQVVLNLVLNALDAMPEGGSLGIRVFERKTSGQICFEIKDTGKGIPEELLTMVHMPFISTKKSGLGLGLAKVYAIVEEHGGSICCSSVVSEGTVFTVYLNR